MVAIQRPENAFYVNPNVRESSAEQMVVEVHVARDV
jgi:hypothetical protein